MEDGVNGAHGVTVLQVVAQAANPEVENVPPQLNQEQEQTVLENQLQVKLVRLQLALVGSHCDITLVVQNQLVKVEHQYS